jgi:hypothetical protein
MYYVFLSKNGDIRLRKKGSKPSNLYFKIEETKSDVKLVPVLKKNGQIFVAPTHTFAVSDDGIRVPAGAVLSSGTSLKSKWCDKLNKGK